MFKHIVMNSPKIKGTFFQIWRCPRQHKHHISKNTDWSHDIWEPIDVIFMCCCFFLKQKNKTLQKALQKLPVLVPIFSDLFATIVRQKGTDYSEQINQTD